MTLPTGFSFTQPTTADRAEVLAHSSLVWASAHPVSDLLTLPQPYEDERAVIVRDQHGQIAAIHASYEFGQFPTPGGDIRAGGLTWVGVHPQYRRRGILRAMIAEHFRLSTHAGEAISVLFAAEPTIYGRFGYGAAAFDVRCTFGRGAALRPLAPTTPTSLQEHASSTHEPLTIRIETYDPTQHTQLIETVHKAAGRNVGGTGLNRPGWVTRDTPALVAAHHHTISLTPGKEPQRIIVVERNGTPVGYTRFRRTMSWQNTGPQGRVDAGEVVALDPAASHTLWTTLLDLDLTSEVTAFMLPTDDPIITQLNNNRSIGMTVVDNVWVRILDLPAALSARQYSGSIDLVLEVTDDMLPHNAGCWRVRAQPFGGPHGHDAPRVERTDAPADVTLDIRELSALYLGGVSAASLAAGGLVTADTPQALAQLSSAMAWPLAPCSSWVF